MHPANQGRRGSVVDDFLFPLGISVIGFQACGQLIGLFGGLLAVGQHHGVGTRQLFFQQLQVLAVGGRFRLLAQVLHAALERQARLAGLALLGTLGGSLASAVADAKTREASLITFLAAAANITLLGIGGAFWGLVIGLIAHVVLNGHLVRRTVLVNNIARDEQA